MIKPITLVAAGLLALSAVPAAQAQRLPDFTRMNLTAMNNSFNYRQNMAMNGTLQGMVNQNINDPRVMAAYRAGVCGRGLTPRQFALKYAALGGCTAQGYANWNNTTQQINANEQNAVRDYRTAQMRRGLAMQTQRDHFSNNQYMAGLQLGGWRYTQTNPPIWYRP